jgi:hypothetical protein
MLPPMMSQLEEALLPEDQDADHLQLACELAWLMPYLVLAGLMLVVCVLPLLSPADVLCGLAATRCP